MPLVRIDLSRDATPQVVQAVSETVYQAMIETDNVPRDVKKVVVTRFFHQCV
jgi:4-oxalocrotonate tautomerase